MVHMPINASGKDRKLACPYHGPYRILAITPTNAKVKLVDCVDDRSIFVALDRLRRCYPELPDTSWTGRQRKTHKRKSKPKVAGDIASTVPQPKTTGPVSRAMARRSQDNK